MARRTMQKETRPSLVPAPVAAMASLIIPGLGQVLARQTGRGLLLLGSVTSTFGLLAWRVQDLAHREPSPLTMLNKALGRQPYFVAGMLVGLAVLWLWTAWDAYRQAQPDRRGGIGIFVLIIALFFALGWQISEIDLYKAANELPDAWPPLSRVLWPWEAAIDREPEESSAGADVLSPCDDEPPPPPPEEV
ncbi:MAG TPA: hypothetical protein ENI37_06560, partial [Chloroflexi bacterium]|nr:hypothetical protein [Chloroflexota bacterium]